MNKSRSLLDAALKLELLQARYRSPQDAAFYALTIINHEKNTFLIRLISSITRS